MKKVLWLSPTPCGAIEKLSPDLVLGGWMQSLEQQLVNSEKFELHVAFHYSKPIKPFKHKKSFYYPVLRANSKNKFDRLFSRAFPNLQNEKKELEQVQEIIKNIVPDIIHVHGTEDNWGLIQKYSSIPTVVSIQGLLSPYSEKYFSGIPKQSAIINEGIKPKLLFNSAMFYYKTMKRNAKREREILGLSKNIMGRTNWDRRISKLLSPESKYYISNEVLRPVFYNNIWNKEKIDSTIKIVSTITEGIYKGLETIVKTAIILQNHTSLFFEWIIIGQNSSATFAKTVKRWLKCDYNSLNIKFSGLQNADEIIEILLESDMFCQVSHIENSPNSLCEAMILGMPIVASFAGGTETILENNEEGIIVQDGDPYSFAGAIVELCQNHERATQFGRQARERALKRHNQESIKNHLIESYNKILQ